MARWARQFVVLMLMFSMGCATVRSPLEYSRALLRPAKPVQREAKEDDETDESRPPLIAQNEEPPETPETSETSETPPVGLAHDPATRMLIQEELRDASPTERQEWIAFLQTVPTVEVAELLKERRMALRRDAETLANAKPERAATGDEDDVVTVGHLDVSRSEDDEASDKSQELALAAAETSPEASPPGTAAGPAWQQRIRSLADPTRLWPNPSDHTDDLPATQAKPDRSPFGLPQILNGKNDTPTANAPQSIPEVATVAAATPPAAPANPKSPLTPGAALWEDETSRLISLLEAEVSASANGGNSPEREEFRKQIALRMLYLVANQPQKALQAIPGLPPEEQEFWTAIFQGLYEHLDEAGATDPAERATQTIAQLRSAAYQLQHSANLRIRNLTFCRKINGFGNYDSFPVDQFEAGQGVLIYSEIRNFKSIPTESGEFLTRIRSTIEIYRVEEGQQLVDRTAFDPTEDRSRTLRTDYFHSYRLDLPATLQRGPHLVKLILFDELSGKQATESIPFVVE